VEKDHKTTDKYTDFILSRIAPFTDIPLVFTSVTSKQRVHKALEWTSKVFENRNRKIPTSTLNDTLLPFIQETPPPQVKGKFVRIKYITQLKMAYPAFAFFCNHPQYIKEPYKRFLTNKIRDNFEFTGSTVQIFFRKK
jgi:GTP-binding protein